MYNFIATKRFFLFFYRIYMFATHKFNFSLKSYRTFAPKKK